MARKDHRKKIIISGVFGILAAIIILGVYFICDYYNSTKKTVTILSEYNHYTATVYGDADVADALSQAGITLRPSDKVYTLSLIHIYKLLQVYRKKNSPCSMKKRDGLCLMK